LQFQSTKRNGRLDHLAIVTELFGTFLQAAWNLLTIDHHDVLVAGETTWNKQMTLIIQVGKIAALAKGQCILSLFFQLMFHAVASGTSVAVGKPPLLSPSRSQPSDDDVSASD
jgi:hypothetical protein